MFCCSRPKFFRREPTISRAAPNSKPGQGGDGPRRSRIEAVDDICLYGVAGCEEAVRWFYGEVAGLQERTPDADGLTALCFKSERIRLRISFVPSVEIDPVPVRVVIVVPALAGIAAVLEEQKLPFERLSGISFSDRRLQVIDPMGYRVELRQSSWVGLL